MCVIAYLLTANKDKTHIDLATISWLQIIVTKMFCISISSPTKMTKYMQLQNEWKYSHLPCLFLYYPLCSVKNMLEHHTYLYHNILCRKSDWWKYIWRTNCFHAETLMGTVCCCITLTQQSSNINDNTFTSEILHLLITFVLQLLCMSIDFCTINVKWCVLSSFHVFVPYITTSVRKLSSFDIILHLI